MTAADQPAPSSPDGRSPASFLAAAAALHAIDDALRAAQQGTSGTPAASPGAEQTLASLLLLRQVREQLAGWETGLIETARHAGATWADLAHPLGVASRQAAERRYLRNRPGPAGTTGEQRVQATRERRAADHPSRMGPPQRRRPAPHRRPDHCLHRPPHRRPPPARPTHAALARNDPADLIHPLNATRPHLTTAHPDLAARLDTLTGNATAPPSPG
ncbi:type III effector protein [Streptomyces sp. NPDC055092]